MADQVHDAQAEVLERLLADGMSPAEEKTAVEHFVRARPALATPLLYAVLAQKHRLRMQLDAATKAFREPPWHQAAFLSFSPNGERALVASGGRRVSVAVAAEVDRLTLRPGQPVFLNANQSVVIEVAPNEPRPGALGEFIRFHGRTQGVIRAETEHEIVLDLAASVLDNSIHRGDLVLYDPETRVAYERLEPRDHASLLDDLPLDIRIEDLGGLNTVFDELISVVTLHLFHADLVRRYALKPTKGVLLCGPPGTGKTSLVQALGERLQRTMQVEIKAFVVRPGVHRSMWFGASEQRVRDLFRHAKEAALQRNCYVLVFFDDMDHLGSRDHRIAGEVDARLLPCFLQEIDALRTNRLLLLGATNREDLLDEALLRPGRFGRTFRIARPSRTQAKEIFKRYLTPDLPVAHNGNGGRAETIKTVIDDMLAALYAPNGEMSRLAMLTFRDGSRRPLTASDVMSGALIAAAVEQGKRRGCFRALDGGPEEIDAEDLRAAMKRELAAICDRLKPGPALQQMLDLPPDRDVVKVERCAPEEQPRAAYLAPSAP
jgi:proteasome-associated ATPase